MNQKIIVESLSMDLLRVALGLHRGSLSMAERFKAEALKREEELESADMQPYLRKLVNNSRDILKSADQDSAEDILMYSVLFQNFARKYY